MELFFGATVAGGLFLCCAAGIYAQQALPETYTTGSPREMIVSLIGLLTLLLALTLGLLIWTAFGVYAGQKSAIDTMALNIYKFEVALSDLGPGAAPLRSAIPRAMKATVEETWGRHDAADFMISNFRKAVANTKERDAFLDTLSTATDAQKAALAAARQASLAISQARQQMAIAVFGVVSYPLIYTVLAWAGILFIAHGLTLKAHPMTYAAAFAAALAIASAMFLILDLSEPYGGYFAVSPAPLLTVAAAFE